MSAARVILEKKNERLRRRRRKKEGGMGVWNSQEGSGVRSGDSLFFLCVIQKVERFAMHCHGIEIQPTYRLISFPSPGGHQLRGKSSRDLRVSDMTSR